MSCSHKKRGKGLCPISFGLAWGLTFALMMLVLAWTAHFTDNGRMTVEHLAAFYNGYAATIQGGLMGALWGLVEGFLWGFFIALFYDLIICCCKCKNCCNKGSCQCNNPNCPCKAKGDCSCGSGCACHCGGSSTTTHHSGGGVSL